METDKKKPSKRECQQAPGPSGPSVGALVVMLERLPAHHRVKEVVINGQTGAVHVRTGHEGLFEWTNVKESITEDGNTA